MGNVFSSGPEEGVKEPETQPPDAEETKTTEIQPEALKKVDLSRATEADLSSLGISEDLAGILAQRASKNKLNSVSDVVTVLEDNGKSCQVEFDDEFCIKHDGTAVVISRKIIHRESRKKRSFRLWRKSSSNERDGQEVGSDHDQEPSEKKQRSFRLHLPIKKRQSSKSDQEDEVSDNDIEVGDPVNVNTATEEDLEAIKGFGPAVSKKIIAYREEHGPFYDVEDLAAVRGVSKKIIKKLGAKLTVGDVEELPRHPDQVVVKLNAVNSGGVLKHKSRDVVRLMSWNLQCFDEDKAANEGVCEVICRTILENGVSIVVIQEIGDEGALTKICEELNNPTLKGVKKSRHHHGQWKCAVSDVAGAMFRSREYNAFLWDASRDIELKSSDLLEKPKKGKKQFARRPYLGFFKTKGLDFVVVSVHLKATGLENEDIARLQKELGRMPDIITALQENIPDEKDMIIVGDFNLDPDEKEFDCFRKAGLSNLIPHTSFTNISTSNMDGSKCYDNIWISEHTKDRAHTTRAGVIRSSMTHQKIPDGWKWGGVVSDHCPVWGEFYCDQDTDKSTGDENVEDITIATAK